MLRLCCFISIFFVFSCGSKNDIQTDHINVEITESNQYLVNHKHVVSEELKKVFLEEKTKIIEAGYLDEEIYIILRVDKNANVKALSTLEVVLRQLNIRKIRYLKNQDVTA